MEGGRRDQGVSAGRGKRGQGGREGDSDTREWKTQDGSSSTEGACALGLSRRSPGGVLKERGGGVLRSDPLDPDPPIHSIPIHSIHLIPTHSIRQVHIHHIPIHHIPIH